MSLTLLGKILVSGKPLKRNETAYILKDHQDRYHDKCPMK
jgi:hypothetical protein